MQIDLFNPSIEKTQFHWSKIIKFFMFANAQISWEMWRNDLKYFVGALCNFRILINLFLQRAHYYRGLVSTAKGFNVKQFRIEHWIWNRKFAFRFVWFFFRFKMKNQKAYGNISGRSWRWTLKAIHLRDVIFLCRSRIIKNTHNRECVFLFFFFFNFLVLFFVCSSSAQILQKCCRNFAQYLFMHCFFIFKNWCCYYITPKKCTTYFIKCASVTLFLSLSKW